VLQKSAENRNYRVTPYMSSGLYMGYMFRDAPTSTFEYICYGVNSRVHIMPLLFSGKNARLDLYAKGQLGVAEILEYDIYTPRLDYLLNAGASFYPLRNLGVFVEGGLKRPYNLFSKRYQPPVRAKHTVLMRQFYFTRYLLFAMCILLGFSCRELVTKDFPDYPPEPVINSILIADSLVRVHVSLAQKMDTMPLPVVDNAIVELWEDSLFLERLEHEGEGYYRSATPAKTGVTYKCRIEVPGLPPAEANARLPLPVVVRNWEHRNFDARDEEGQTYPSAIFTVANIPATPAYFEVCILQENYDDIFAPATLVLFSDPALAG
jgi:hypothetical protein